MFRVHAWLMAVLLATACSSPAAGPAPANYEQARGSWAGPEDVSQWIGAHFRYDHERSRALASDRDPGTAPSIKTPSELFAAPEGVCVDLARFGVETLHAIAPELQPRYLMVEFEPMVRDGRTFRKHWLATFTRDGGLYAFADSKRPGHLVGPYPSLEAMVEAYATFRERPIVQAALRDSFRAQRKRKQRKSAAHRRSRGAPSSSHGE